MKPEAKEEELKRQVLELYLQNCTYREITEQTEVSLGKISEIVQNIKSDIVANPPMPSDLWLI